MKVDTSKLEWDLSQYVSGDLDKQLEEEKARSKEFVEGFISKWKEGSKFLESSENLAAALNELDEFNSRHGILNNIGQYYHMRHQKDQLDEAVLAKLNLIQEFAVELSNKLTFFDLELAKVSEEKRKEFLASESLKEYRHYLEKIFRDSKYFLSEDVENVLSLKSGPAYEDWVSLTARLLAGEEREVFTGEKTEVKNFAEIQGLLNDGNKKVRDSAAVAFNDVLVKHADVATAEINAILKDNVINHKLRGIERADEGRIVGDDIDFEFVDSLRVAVRDKYSLAHRFYELKSKLLGLKKLEYHERNVSVGSVEKKISYEEGVEIVYDSFLKLDEEFAEIFKKFVEEGNIDVYPAKGKWHGAFCAWGLKVHPVLILLNYMNKPRDVMTLAHESGHGLNHELMKKQKSINYAVPMVTAEVASTFAEAVVFDDLIEKIDNDEEKLAMLMEKLNDDLSSIARQVACYNFERDLHEAYEKSGYLSKEDIGKLFQKNMEAYMGEFVEQSEGSENWWVYWPHIREFFYVYSYASGVLISRSMFSKVREDSGFVSKVKEFLETGKSKSPRQCFEDMGLEINKEFWIRGLDEIETMLDKTEELARKLGKIDSEVLG